MIHIEDAGISAETTTHLQGKQAVIDGVADYGERRQRAQRDWKGKDGKSDAFKEIKYKLTNMCHGPGRCGYCEDSEANQIEHIQPKSLYPEATFVWANYLYACGGCNLVKLNHYAVFRHTDRQRVDHVHPRKSKANPTPVLTPPPAGDPLFINPRVDDPMSLLFLDFKTMMFTEIADDENSEDYQRASYTIEKLHLNKRDALVEARRVAYRNYLAHLRNYATGLADGTYSEQQLDEIEQDINDNPHSTVWKEMQRQHNLPLGEANKAYPELHAFFEQVPDALNW